MKYLIIIALLFSFATVASAAPFSYFTQEKEVTIKTILREAGVSEKQIRKIIKKLESKSKPVKTKIKSMPITTTTQA